MLSASRLIIRSASKAKTFHSSALVQGKVLVALYPDPVSGYPPKYARDSIPTITSYPDGTTTPSPKAIVSCYFVAVSFLNINSSIFVGLCSRSFTWMRFWRVGSSQICRIKRSSTNCNV